MRWRALLFCSLTQLVFAFSDHQKVINDNNELESIRKELVNADIIPEVIGNFYPKYVLSVTWPSKKTANLGNAIVPDDVQDEPAVKLHSIHDSNQQPSDITSQSTIAIAMTDPDAPSRNDPKWSEFCHWIVTKVLVTKLCKSEPLAEIKQEDVVSYRPPSPPEKTGFHRYVFLAFTPKNGTTDKLDLTKPEERKRWGTGKQRHGVRDWANENGLVPIAGNFIYVQNPKQS